MPVAKLRSSGTLDGGNDSVDNIIRQAIGKEPYLSYSKTGDSPVQWIQLLHALDQQDHPGWPLLYPLKVQMQKCDKCSREFCSSINYRRHIRVHRRSFNFDKDSSAVSRDLLGAFWDKLSFDDAKESLSLKNVGLEEVPGSSIIKALTSFIRKAGFSSLPQVYVKAGSALLDIVQGRGARFPISSDELFNILDDASEKTFLCGVAGSMQRYIFDGEAEKIGLEMKNLVACTSFLVEQKLVKMWVTEKDAEAMTCQKLLVEEEEAAEKRKADLLEKKRQKKLRQKAKEQANVYSVAPTEISTSPTVSDSDSHILETPPDSRPSPHESIQLGYLEQNTYVESQLGLNSVSPGLCTCLDVEVSNSHAQGTPHDSAPSILGPIQFEKQNIPHFDSSTCLDSTDSDLRTHGTSPDSAPSKLQPSQLENLEQSTHENHNILHFDSGTSLDCKHRIILGSTRPRRKVSKTLPGVTNGASQRHLTNKELRTPQIGTKIWTRKHKSENDRISCKKVDQIEVSKPHQNKRSEILIGSISVCLGNYGGQHDGCETDNTMLKNNFEEPTSKLEISSFSGQPDNTVSEIDVTLEKSVDTALSSESCVTSCGADDALNASETNSVSPSEESESRGCFQFSVRAAEAFLAKRWRDAIAGEHVVLLSPESSESQNDFESEPRLPNSQKRRFVSTPENRLKNGTSFQPSNAATLKDKLRKNPEKGVKLKYIPKQRPTV